MRAPTYELLCKPAQSTLAFNQVEKSIMGSNPMQFAKHKGNMFDKIKFIPYPMDYGDMEWNGIKYNRSRRIILCTEFEVVELVIEIPSYQMRTIPYIGPHIPTS